MTLTPSWSQYVELPIQGDAAAHRARMALGALSLRREPAFRSRGKLTATTWPSRKTLGKTLTIKVRELDPHGDMTRVTVASESRFPPWFDFGSNRALVERILRFPENVKG